MSRVPPVGGASPTAARSREVYPSRIMRDKTGDLKKRQDRRVGDEGYSLRWTIKEYF
jgi:hypothetical protein